MTREGINLPFCNKIPYKFSHKLDIRDYNKSPYSFYFSFYVKKLKFWEKIFNFKIFIKKSDLLNFLFIKKLTGVDGFWKKEILTY